MRAAGKALAAVTKAGVTRINGPTFGFSDTTRLEEQALRRAVENAHSKAQALAQTAGVELGKVYSITQSAYSQPVPRHLSNTMSLSRAAESVPVSAGEDEITARVDVVYSLK